MWKSETVVLSTAAIWVIKMQSVEHQVKLDDLMPLFREQLDAGKTVKFSPRGISMLPMLRQGVDSVVLSPLPEKLQKYDLPLYRRDNGKYVLHRIVEVGDTYTCVGDNQFQLEENIRHDQMIAVVSTFTRDCREYSADHPGYQLYCRIWHHSRPIRHFWRRAKGWIRRNLLK